MLAWFVVYCADSTGVGSNAMGLSEKYKGNCDAMQPRIPAILHGCYVYMSVIRLCGSTGWYEIGSTVGFYGAVISNR